MEIVKHCPKSRAEPLNRRPPFWLKELTKEHLNVVIDRELGKITDVSRISWKDAAMRVLKSVKDCPEMVSLLQTVKTEIGILAPDLMYSMSNQSLTDKRYQSPDSGDTEMDFYDDSHQRQIVEDTSYYKPLDTRLKALRSLVHVQPLEAISSEYWMQLQQNLLDGLCDKDKDVFDLCIKIHAKILSSSSPPEVIKDGFLSLIEGLRSYYSRKFHDLLPMFESGINTKVSVHSHVLRISHLILHTLKQMPKNWIKYGKNIVNEIVDSFLAVLTMHTYETMYSQTFLYPFHIFSIFDPEANWCAACFYGKFGFDIFLSKQTRIVVLFRYIIEEVHSFLTSSSSNVMSDPSNDFSCEKMKFSNFLHCINILSIIGSSKSGQLLFPLTSSIQDNSQQTLPHISERLLVFLNNRNNSSVVLERNIMNAVMRLMKCKDSPLVRDRGFLSALLSPLEKVTEDSSRVPVHTLRLLAELSTSVEGRYRLLGVGVLDVPIIQGRKQSALMFFQHDDVCPARPVLQSLSALLKNKHGNTEVLIPLLQIATKLYSYHDAVIVLSDLDVTVVAPAVRKYKELSSMYDIHQETPTNMQSQALLSTLREFLWEVGSSPLGTVELSRYDSLVADLLRTVLGMLIVPWYDYKLRRTMGLMIALPEGATTLAEEGSKALSRALEKLWAAHEADDHFIKGLNRDIELAEKEFFSIVYSMSCTLEGAQALLAEQHGSEHTLVEGGLNPPSSVAELLTLECGSDPWHYTGLLVLRILASSLDCWLYLENSRSIQSHLLSLQKENTIQPVGDMDPEEKPTKRKIIVDECSLLRHQILVSTYLIGGPRERMVPSLRGVLDCLEEDDVPRLLDELPTAPIKSPNIRSSRSKTFSNLHKFLQETRKGLHDSNWLVRARKLFRHACHEPFKANVVLDLVEQVALCSSRTQPSIEWPSDTSTNSSSLCGEEILAINMAVRYGTQTRQLQVCRPNTDNLTHFLLLTQDALNHHPNIPKFKGFDWFTATIFLLCGGNIDKCCNFINQFVALPAATVLWPFLAEAKGMPNFMFTFSHLLESLVATELPTLHGALKLGGVPGGLVCFSWLHQSFWNILDWGQICQWLAVCALHPADMCLYFFVALLRHIQPTIIKEAVNGNVWEAIKLTPITGFCIGDSVGYMEELSRRHRSRILPKLQDSTVLQDPRS